MDDDNSQSDSKSYFSDDDDSQEELLMYLLNVLNEIYSEIAIVSDINEIVNEEYIARIILSFEPNFEDETSTELKITKSDSFDAKYKNFKFINEALKCFVNKKKETVKFKDEFIIDDLININNVINKSRSDLLMLIKIILVFISTSANKDKYIDKLSEKKEKYLDGFLTVIQKFIELTDEGTADQIDPKCRRFTTRSSVLFAFKDPAMLWASIDKLRRRIEDLEEENKNYKHTVNALSDERDKLKNQLQEEIDSKVNMQKKEEELSTEVSYLRNKLNKHSFIVNEEITGSSERENHLQSELMQRERDISAMKEEYEAKLKEYVIKTAEMEHRVSEGAKNEDRAKKIIDEHSKMKKEFDMKVKEFSFQNEQLTAIIETLKANVKSLEKDKKEMQSKVVSLRSELKKETEKNKFLESKIEKNNSTMRTQQIEKEKKTENNNDYIKQIEMLINEVKDKNIEICELNKEIVLLKAKSEKKQFLIIQKREDVFYFSTLTDATKQIKKLKEEIKKRDKDISFLKSSYKDLKSTSEDEYNTVSSSLYELALHLTKMKNELNKK